MRSVWPVNVVVVKIKTNSPCPISSRTRGLGLKKVSFSSDHCNETDNGTTRILVTAWSEDP